MMVPREFFPPPFFQMVELPVLHSRRRGYIPFTVMISFHWMGSMVGRIRMFCKAMFLKYLSFIQIANMDVFSQIPATFLMGDAVAITSRFLTPNPQFLGKNNFYHGILFLPSHMN